MNINQPWFAPTIVALGITVGGAFVGTGFARGRATDRFVSVKGASEREVKADLALWPLRLIVTGDDLAAAQSQLARATSPRSMDS